MTNVKVLKACQTMSDAPVVFVRGQFPTIFVIHAGVVGCPEASIKLFGMVFSLTRFT